MPSWAEFQPYIVTGLALGGLYALSGVGLVVLYRATGVLNLAFGAVGAMGAFIAYSIIQAGNPGWVGWITCILFGGVVTLGYGMIFGPALAGRGPLVQSVCHARPGAGALRGHRPAVADHRRPVAVDLASRPTTAGSRVGQLQVNWTQVIALGARRRHHRRHRARSCATPSWAPRCARWPTTGRSPRRSASRSAGSRRPPGWAAACWPASPGSCLPTWSALDDTTLIFTVVISSLAAALIAPAALDLGHVRRGDRDRPGTRPDHADHPITNYRDMTPFVLAVIALLVMSRTGRS